MKNKLLPLLLILLMLALAACGGAAESSLPADSFQSGAQLNRLGFGILMLEGTDLAVTPEQAESLLPLWKLTKTLAESDTTVQAEITATLELIEKALTEAQLADIGAAEFDQEKIAEIMADLGIEFTARGGKSPSEFNKDGAAGGFPGGGLPGEGAGKAGGKGGIGGAGEELSPEQQATREAFLESRGGGFGFNTGLIDAVIALLDGKL
ncbi:MAG: hypothetical protein OEY93_07610 [Anaerolineae bacterium]|nr:hypothetical protein [Anaerolineae bacterium]